MTTWDYLATHPDMSHVSYLDDKSVMELFDRAQIDPKQLSKGAPHEQVMAVYDKHPTHWLCFTIYSGYEDPKDNGYGVVGFAKKHYTRERAYGRFTAMFYHSGATLRHGEKVEFPDPKP